MSQSTSTHLDAVVARIKSYTSPTSGETMARLAKNRVYKGRSPDGAPFPHVVVRKINVFSDPFVSVRENFDVEVMCHHRPRTKEADLDVIADLVQQALTAWVESSAAVGLTFSRGWQRDRLDFDDEVITQRLLFPCSSLSTLVTAVYT